MSFPITITDAGRAALRNAESNGTAPVLLAEVGLSSQAFTPGKSMTSLPGQIKRLRTVAGEVQGPHALHVTVLDDSAQVYTVHGFGLFLDDGTLFGVYAQPDPMLQKANQTILLMALDIAIESLDVTALAFGDTTFSNPPATTERAGVVELATPEETVTGQDGTRAASPAGVAAAVAAYAARRDNPNAVTAAQVGAPPTSRTITAGAGLTGGGSLSANRTLALGTPGTLTTATTNSVTAESHTHAVSFPVTSVAGKTGAVALALADVGGLPAALDGKVDTTDSRLTNSRKWTASTVSQAEAEAGTATTRRAWTAQRVRQAIAAFTEAFTAAEKTKLAGIAAGATKNATDAQLRDRGSHTGTQAISTIAGLQTALDTNEFKRGMIMMWSPSAGAIPAGWALCDGQNGTPDLRDRFIVGAGGAYATGDTGGASTATTNSAGAHTHPVSVTVNAHTLTEAQMPLHRHRSGNRIHPGWPEERQAYAAYGVETGGGHQWVATHRTAAEGSQFGLTSDTGGSGSHSHTASGSTTSSGAHTHTVNTLPPYYALALIMKL